MNSISLSVGDLNAAALAGLIEGNLSPLMLSVSRQSPANPNGLHRINVWNKKHQCSWINISHNKTVSVQEGSRFRDLTLDEIRVLITTHNKEDVEDILWPNASVIGVLN